jgi:hypothetical protein
MKAKVETKPGDWVLLKGDHVIASDPDAAKIIMLADKLQDGELVISKEPVSQHCYY